MDCEDVLEGDVGSEESELREALSLSISFCSSRILRSCESLVALANSWRDLSRWSVIGLSSWVMSPV